MQRAGILVELAPLLGEQGIDAAKLFAAAGIARPPASPEARLPFDALLRAIEMAAEQAGLPSLGLVLGKRFHLQHHGPIGELMRCAPTLGQALMDFTSWQPGYSSGAVVYLHRFGTDYAFGYGATGRGNRVLYDLVTAIGLRMIEQLTGGTVKPDEVHLSHRQPADRASYARYLNVPVRFNERRVCLVLSGAALATRLPGADHGRHEAIRATLGASLRGAMPDVSSRTRHALRHLLQQGAPSMGAAARELALHPRTLRRHLAREQTSFDALCDAIRFDMARELLELTDLPVGEISAALAYASPSVFTDAFRRWSGLSPSAWRRGPHLEAVPEQGPRRTSRLAIHAAPD